MLSQQLRELERDGVLFRAVYPEVPPRVDYRLTDWGRALCPAIDALLSWGACQPETRGTSLQQSADAVR